MALWLGLCTFTATALRHFHAYSAVLAGYTAAIVGMAAVTAPQHSFDVAFARTTYVLLGIAVEAAVRTAVTIEFPLQAVRARLDCFLLDAGQVCASALQGQRDDRALHALFADAVALENAAQFAATASHDVRRSLGHVRAAILATLAQLVTAEALRRSVGTSVIAMNLRAAAVTCVVEPLDDDAALHVLQERTGRLFDEQAIGGAPSSELIQIDRVAGMLASLV